MERSSFFNKKNYSSPTTDKVISDSGSKFTAKVFLYMLIALAITAVTSCISGAILSSMVASSNEAGIEIFATVLIISLIAYIPVMIWTQISVLRGGKGLVPAFTIYSVLMGLLLSTLTAFLDFYLIAAAFGLTCGAFAVMALIAWTSKKNLSYLAIVGTGLLSGIFLIAMLSLILSFFLPRETVILDAIVSGGIFIFIILVTISDLYNIRSIAARGETSENLAMVCAFSLYVDFIYIFIRILYVLIRLAAILGINRR